MSNLRESAIRLYHRAKFRDTKRELNYYCSALFFVVLEGFEPPQAEPESDVLPLHHKTILVGKTNRLGCFGFAIAKLRRNIVSCKYLRPFFYFFYQQTKYQHNIQTQYFLFFYTQYTQTANYPYFDSHMTCIFVYFT